MDRFKFRAYIQKYNKLVNVYNIGVDMGACPWVLHSSIYDTPDGKPVLDDWGSVDERFSNIVNRTKLIYCILEQCTGLKDKNGKLIYEGDILKSIFSDEKLYEVIWCADCYKLRVFTKSSRKTLEYLGLKNTKTSYEIIGNIHEGDYNENK